VAVAAAFFGVATAGVVDQHLPHGTGESPEQLVAVRRLGELVILPEPQPCFVRQVRGRGNSWSTL
jgi:hypothetical protein